MDSLTFLKPEIINAACAIIALGCIIFLVITIRRATRKYYRQAYGKEKLNHLNKRRKQELPNK